MSHSKIASAGNGTDPLTPSLSKLPYPMTIADFSYSGFADRYGIDEMRLMRRNVYWSIPRKTEVIAD